VIIPDSDVRAAVYTRVSHVLDDDRTNVGDQDRIGRERAAQLGWQVARTYTDNSKSAWQRNRKRPGWDAMLADIEAGKVNAIVVYHGDRLMRQPRDLEDLIDLADGKGVRLASPAGTRDLSSHDDLFILRIEVAHACRSSADTSRRLKAHHERRRRAGRRPTGGWGGRPFGWQTDAHTPVPAEQDVIAEMAARVLAGESLGSVARDLTARGVRTPAGNAVAYDTVRRLLARPHVAGLMPDGETAGAWQAPLDRATWERVRLVLGARAAAMPAYGVTPGRRWLLSGIATCSQCGHGLLVRGVGPSRPAGAAGYACGQPGCGKVYRSALHLDAYVCAVVVARLADEGNPDGREAPADHGAEWAALTAERAEAEQLLADFGASPGRARLLMRRLDAIDERMAALREGEGAGARARLLRRHQGITLEQLDGLELDEKRALVAATVTVTVLPASGRGRGFRPQDVRVEPAVG
jgi:DNA invertase Pin-like site-specific DNA recombinase